MPVKETKCAYTNCTPSPVIVIEKEFLEMMQSIDMRNYMSAKREIIIMPPIRRRRKVARVSPFSFTIPGHRFLNRLILYLFVLLQKIVNFNNLTVSFSVFLKVFKVSSDTLRTL